jgi:hypothetical protein
MIVADMNPQTPEGYEKEERMGVVTDDHGERVAAGTCTFFVFVLHCHK